MTNKITIVLIGLYAFLTSALLLTKIFELKQSKKQIQEMSEHYNSSLIAMNTDLYLELLSNNMIVSDSLKIENPSGKIFRLNQLAKEKLKIILYIEQTHCSNCWGAILEKFINNYPDVVNSDLIVLSSFQNFREIIISLKEKGINSSVYNIVEGDMDFPVCKPNSPFLCILNENKKMFNFCIIHNQELKKVDSFISAFINISQTTLTQVGQENQRFPK
ncbi:MAG: hypothetical protein D4R64_00930 [Porphyromonadaceae bacterium]|nr:MAG: hypothetical protein D4R64_00930 [Porphyromonadaceae bacterium]